MAVRCSGRVGSEGRGMTVLTFPSSPSRIVTIEWLWGDCRAYYRGDLWTEEFQTDWYSSLAELERELRFKGFCQRLPIVEHDFDQGAVP